MNRRMAYRLVLVAVVAIALTASVANAQTVSNGPYYATPSWDQKLDPAVRFIILANWNSEAVLDRETGLVWQRTPAGGSASDTRPAGRCVACRKPVAEWDGVCRPATS